MPIRELIGLPLEPLDTEGEYIAAAAHRFDYRRLFRVDLQLAPKPPYLNVDRPVFRPSLPIAGEIEQPVAGQHLIGVADEGREQIEFAGGDIDLLHGKPEKALAESALFSSVRRH